MLPQLLLLLLPLLRRIALGRPRVYRRDLRLQRRVHETVSREEGLLVELGGDDYCIEGLTAAACAWGVSGRSGVCQGEGEGVVFLAISFAQPRRHLSAGGAYRTCLQSRRARRQAWT
jgi:hypothetical protein